MLNKIVNSFDTTKSKSLASSKLLYDHKFSPKNNSYLSLSSTLENGSYYDTSAKHHDYNFVNANSYPSNNMTDTEEEENDEFFFTDQITYINIISNILNLIYATDKDFKSIEDNPNNDILPLHLLYDRIYLQYCNIMNNINIDRFILKNYKQIGSALDYYLVNYMSFTNLQNDELIMTLFEEESIPFDYYTPNLLCQTYKEDEILYILQHHIGGIRNSQSYITNELVFSENENNEVTKLLEKKIERKRYMYLDHDKEVYWMITIDDMKDDTAVLTVMPLSLIINENDSMKKKTISLNKYKDVFITNKLLNFMFFEKIEVVNVSNFTMYEYILNKINIDEYKSSVNENGDYVDDVIVNRIIATGGFNKSYKEITKILKKTNEKSKKLNNNKINTENSYSSSLGRDNLTISHSPTNFANPCSPTLQFSKQRITFNVNHNAPNDSSNANMLHNEYSHGYRPTCLSQTTENSNITDIVSPQTQHKLPLIFKNIMLLMSPVSKLLIFTILIQIKNHNQKDTKLIISNSWRFLLAGSLFVSIVFTFLNIMFIIFNVYEIIMCSIDMVLVFALLFGVLVWVL
ncbi:hypothetical protein QEN19_001767 [Hanseniaspora menglaensis]